MKQFLFTIIGCVIVLGSICPHPVHAGDYFKKTEVQLHFDMDRDIGLKEANGDDIKKDILTASFVHFSEWKYGDTFAWFDIEGEDDYKAELAQFYGEIGTRFSLDKIILGPEKNKLLPVSFIKESYVKLEYNAGSPFEGFDYIDDAVLYGMSFDFDLGQPNFGFSNLTLFVKDYTAVDGRDSSDTTWQVTLAWGQPFSIGFLDMDFQGFIDVWEYNDETVFLSEPQLRLKLSSFVGKDNFLSDTEIGLEFEISNRFFNQQDSDWYVNPTIFWAMVF